MSLENKNQEVSEAATAVTHEVAPSNNPLSALGISPSLFAFQLLNFAVIAAIIWYLILKPITKKMNERQKLIDESIDNSRKIQDNLRHSEQKYQEKIDIAKVEAMKILEKAVVDAEKSSNEMKEKAKFEIEGLVNQAKKNIKSEREDMVMEVKKYAADLIATALEKILSEKITDKKDHQLIDEMIKKIN